MNTESFLSLRKRITDNCQKVILGKEEAIVRILTAFLCDGHVLLEDVPGTGKTMLLRAFSASLGGDFKRIQFTPDLLPSDLTGINFFNMKDQEFEFRKGPLFSEIILADEINRATPRTQAALLEAMEEYQISVDGVTYPMSDPFMVLASQNPLESFGTFPLPEAQIDRFFMRLSLGYMRREEELEVIARRPAMEIVKELEPVTDKEEIRALRKAVYDVHVADDVKKYLMDLVERTREEERFTTGVSTRGAIALYRACQAYAALNGRDYVLPEDIRALAPCVLAHRVGSGVRAKDSESYILDLLEKIDVPTEEA